MPGEARRYSWPPFLPGNTVGPRFEEGNAAAEKHGAYNERRVGPLARQYAAQLVEQVSSDPESRWAFLADPMFRPSIDALARTTARLHLVMAWLDAPADGGDGPADGGDGPPRSDLTEDGEVRAAAGLLDRLEKRAESLRARLGLDPTALARLGRDVAAGSVDVARLMAQAAEAEAEEERQQAAELSARGGGELPDGDDVDDDRQEDDP